MGKLLYDAIRRGNDDSCYQDLFITPYSELTFGKEESFSSISFLQALNSLIQTHSLPPSLIGSSFPFNHNLSPFSKDSSAREVVVDLKWSWSSVTERDELVGKISLVSRLPQYLLSALHIEMKTTAYLMTAILTGAVDVAS